MLVLLPWCGTNSMSQCSGRSANTSSRPGDWRSAGKNTRRPPYSTESTMLLALEVDGRPCGGGWRTSSQQPGPPDKPIAAGNHADRHLRPLDRLAQEADRGVLLVEHHRRDVNRSHGEPLQQFRQGVVVIGVGVREHDRVDVREPPRPEVARDDAAAGGRRRHAAGVVKDRAAVGQFQHDRLAMADAEERTPQAVAIGGPPRDDDAGRRPGPQQRQPPAQRRTKPRKGRENRQPGIQADQPPLGRPGHPGVSIGHVLAKPHQPLDGGKLPVADHGAHRRQRTGDHAAQQQGQPADQGPGHRQPDQPC